MLVDLRKPWQSQRNQCCTIDWESLTTIIFLAFSLNGVYPDITSYIGVPADNQSTMLEWPAKAMYALLPTIKRDALNWWSHEDGWLVNLLFPVRCIYLWKEWLSHCRWDRLRRWCGGCSLQAWLCGVEGVYIWWEITTGVVVGAKVRGWMPELNHGVGWCFWEWSGGLDCSKDVGATSWDSRFAQGHSPPCRLDSQWARAVVGILKPGIKALQHVFGDFLHRPEDCTLICGWKLSCLLLSDSFCLLTFHAHLTIWYVVKGGWTIYSW